MYTASAPLGETAQKLRKSTLDLFEYINTVCDRIEQVEPQVQSLVPENNRRQRLLREAEALQQRFPSPDDRPPLYGILLGVKDIFRVDGFATHAGSQLPPEEFAGEEATCVTQLRHAGALILGKTVTTEFAYFEPGPTRNPHNLNHTPGGSSSGSAAAVASGLCPLALGTQTIGSVIRPAAYCGIIGFKPSYDRISTDGLILFSSSADHVGFFTQDIEGIDLAASVLCHNWRPVISQEIDDARPVLGVPEGKYLEQASAEGLAAFETHLQQLGQAGYTIKRIRAFEDIEDINQRHRQLVAAEFALEHKIWFRKYQARYRPRTAQLVLDGQLVIPDELVTDRASQLDLREQLETLLTDAALDLWISPPAPGDAPEGIHATGQPIMNLPWTHAGLPTLTLPAGTSSRGLPLGIQLSAAFMADEQLIAWTKGIYRSLREL
jgi:Asp-tRNA(Asn)/Glu-tRNA(Gln) amidotransferase A subunit family amidase